MQLGISYLQLFCAPTTCTKWYVQFFFFCGATFDVLAYFLSVAKFFCTAFIFFHINILGWNNYHCAKEIYTSTFWHHTCDLCYIFLATWLKLFARIPKVTAFSVGRKVLITVSTVCGAMSVCVHVGLAKEAKFAPSWWKLAVFVLETCHSLFAHGGIVYKWIVVMSVTKKIRQCYIAFRALAKMNRTLVNAKFARVPPSLFSTWVLCCFKMQHNGGVHCCTRFSSKQIFFFSFIKIWGCVCVIFLAKKILIKLSWKQF